MSTETFSPASSANSTLIHAASLREVCWPQDAVFIIDAALPDALIAPFREISQPLFVEAGESLKSLSQIGILAEEILKIRSTRPLTLVAVGGGSIGDALGFLASILWRGVNLWHVPTTLLAMVDSAHGGKTALNLGGRKNQLGTFYPASKVVLARDFLNSLPFSLREEGLAELLKALWLGDPDGLRLLDDHGSWEKLLAGDVEENSALWEEALSRAVAVKERVVEKDPFEKSGLRRILNLGHTAGHGLEALYALPHGRAVAWGIAAAAFLSHQKADLPLAERNRLLAHLEPLLVPLPDSFSPEELQRFRHCLRADKKQKAGKLVSILLQAPGVPVQVTEISPDQWWDALRQAYHWWRSRPLSIRPPSTPTSITPPANLPADKSQANRAAVIAALRPGPTSLYLPDGTLSADIADMTRAVRLLKQAAPSDDLTLFTGEGGTVGRFLLASAAARNARTHLIFGPGLRKRPQDPLLDALRAAGAEINAVDDGFLVQGWPSPPEKLVVDASRSSQFASALALLSASGLSLDLEIQGDPVSAPYFQLTLELLRTAGVSIEEIAPQIFSFRPTPQLQEPLELQIPSDTSASVVWRALAALSGAEFSWPPEDPRHPDAAFADLAAALLKKSADETLIADLKDSPDLAPVLAALATALPPSLLIQGAAHLRFKESDRIEDLKAAFADLAISLEAREDGLRVPEGVSPAAHSGPFDARGDHRLAMAALLLSSHTEEVIVKDAQSVIKSYPDLWRHARQKGFSIQTLKKETPS